MSDSETDPMAAYERLRGDAGTLFSLSLDRKIAVAVVGLGIAAMFGPVLSMQSEAVQALEGGPGASLNIVGGIAVLLGVVSMLSGAAALVYQKYHVGRRVSDEDRMVWHLRIEDLWMWAVLLGVVITVLCMTLVTPSAFSLTSPEAVSDAGFGIYTEFDPLPVVIGAWAVSGVAVGALLTIVLGWLWVRFSLP